MLPNHTLQMIDDDVIDNELNVAVYNHFRVNSCSRYTGGVCMLKAIMM